MNAGVLKICMNAGVVKLGSTGGKEETDDREAEEDELMFGRVRP